MFFNTKALSNLNEMQHNVNPWSTQIYTDSLKNVCLYFWRACAPSHLIFSLQFALPLESARVTAMTLLWQKEVMWLCSVQQRACQDQQSHGWKMGGPSQACIVPRFWTREGCCRLKMLRCQTQDATPASLLMWQDRPTASMTSVYMVCSLKCFITLFFALIFFVVIFWSESLNI